MILLRVSLFFIVLLLLPDWYIYKVYIKYIQHKWQKRLYWLPTVLLLMVLLVFIVAHDSLHDAFGIYLIVTLCAAVPKLVFVLCDILMKVLRKFLRIPLFGKTVSSVVAIVTLAYLLFGAIKGKEYFQVKQVVFSSPDLPESFEDIVFFNCPTYMPEAGKVMLKHSVGLLKSVTHSTLIWPCLRVIW